MSSSGVAGRRIPAVVAALTLIAAACTAAPSTAPAGSGATGSQAAGGSGAPSSAAAKTTLNLIEQEPRSLDPNIVVDFSSATINQLLEPGYIIKTDGSIDYLSIKSVDVSPDNMTFTFTIDPNYKWSDGTPVTAQDYAFSWMRVLDPKTASEGAAFLFDIKGASDYNSGKVKDPSTVGIQATSATTLVVTTGHPAPWFKSVVALPYFPAVPMKVVQQYGDQWTDPSHMVSDGAYKLTTWDHGKQIVLDANPYYGGTAPSIKHVVLTITSSDPCVAQQRAFETAAVDMTTCVPPTDLARVKSDPTLSKELVVHPVSGTVWVQYDNSQAPFNDVRVRQAMAMVVDRQAIVQAITQGTAKVAPVLVPTDIPGNNPSDAFSGTADQAKQLLTQAGFPNGQGFPTFQIMASSARSQQQIAEILQQTWKDTLGITANVTVLEENAYRAWVKDRATQPYQVVVEQWYSDYADPQDWYDQVFGADDSRHMHYNDPAFLSLLQQADAATDPTTRIGLYKQADAILEKDQPSTSLYYPSNLYLMQPCLQGMFVGEAIIDAYYFRAGSFSC